MNKLSMLELALQLTKTNLVKSRTGKKSTNDYLVELLKDGPKSRIELVNEITIKRLQDQHEFSEKEIFENLTKKDPEFIELFIKVNTTSKNGLDSSIAQGKSSSCFINSIHGEKFDLFQNLAKNFCLVEKSKS
jgi:hypothetical protein